MGECRVPRIINRLLFPNERIAFALKGIRDIMVFTNCRILYVDYRQVTGKSVEYATYMFRDIISYSIVTPGYGLDCDSEIILRFINREVLIISVDKGNNMDRYLFLTYDLVSAGSELKVRENGRARIEGKEYVMQDGDVVLFRFNV